MLVIEPVETTKKIRRLHKLSEVLEYLQWTTYIFAMYIDFHVEVKFHYFILRKLQEPDGSTLVFEFSIFVIS